MPKAIQQASLFDPPPEPPQSTLECPVTNEPPPPRVPVPEPPSWGESLAIYFGGR